MFDDSRRNRNHEEGLRLGPKSIAAIAALGVSAVGLAGLGIAKLAEAAEKAKAEELTKVTFLLEQGNNSGPIAVKSDKTIKIIDPADVLDGDLNPRVYRVNCTPENLLWISPSKIAFSCTNTGIISNIELAPEEERYRSTVHSDLIKILDIDGGTVITLVNPYNPTQNSITDIFGDVKEADAIQADQLTAEKVEFFADSGGGIKVWHGGDTGAFDVHDIGFSEIENSCFVKVSGKWYEIDPETGEMFTRDLLPKDLSGSQTQSQHGSLAIRDYPLVPLSLERTIDRKASFSFGYGVADPAWNVYDWPHREARQYRAATEPEGDVAANESLLDQGWNSFTSGLENGTAFLSDQSGLNSEAAAQAWGSIESVLADVDGELTQEQAITILAHTGVLIDTGLHSLGENPEAERSQQENIALMVLKKAPGVGATVRYADARELYEYALSSTEIGEDESFSMQHEAKQQCLLACVEMGLDISTLGSSGVLKQALTKVDKILSLMKMADKAAAYTEQDLELINQATDLALRDPRVDQAMEDLLVIEFSELLDFRDETLSDSSPQ